MTKYLLAVLLPALLVVCGCATRGEAPQPEGPATFKRVLDIRTNGFRRNYLVHVPSGYRPDVSLPLVVVLHGAFDTAEGMETLTGFSKLADREGFVVIYPNGIGILGFLQHWNAGHCCGKAAEEKIDDVGYLAAAIGDVQSILSIDANRIYMGGFSNGGMMTYRFAAERGDLLAAIAPLAAAAGGQVSPETPEWHIPEPIAPLSVIAIHGLADDDVRHAGGVSLHRGGTRTYWPVEKSLQVWIRRNGCHPKAAETSESGGAVQLRWWGLCEGNTEVALYLLEDWGHVWPGGAFTASLPQGNPLKDFEAAEVIWEFFNRQRRQP